MPDRSDDVYFDSNGVLTEHRRLDGLELVVHYDDIPATDITTVRGIPCTTALRTVIDLASDLSPFELARAVQDCLRRGLFTVDEAWARIAEPDMQERLRREAAAPSPPRRSRSLIRRQIPGLDAGITLRRGADCVYARHIA